MFLYTYIHINMYTYKDSAGTRRKKSLFFVYRTPPPCAVHINVDCCQSHIATHNAATHSAQKDSPLSNVPSEITI